MYETQQIRNELSNFLDENDFDSGLAVKFGNLMLKVNKNLEEIEKKMLIGVQRCRNCQRNKINESTYKILVYKDISEFHNAIPQEILNLHISNNNIRFLSDIEKRLCFSCLLEMLYFSNYSYADKFLNDRWINRDGVPNCIKRDCKYKASLNFEAEEFNQNLILIKDISFHLSYCKRHQSRTEKNFIKQLT